MLRAFVISILGWRVVSALRSTSIHVTPRCTSSHASVMPTGPPPAMSTCTCFMRWLVRSVQPAAVGWRLKKRGVTGLFDLNVRVAHNRLPYLRLCSHVRGELFRRARRGLEAKHG